MKTDNPVKSIELPRFLQPILLLASAALPQIILVCVNLYHYSIVSGEIKDYSRVIRYFFAAEILLAIFFVAVSVFLFIRKRSIGIIIPILSIILSSSYLWIISAKLSNVLPRVPSWIVSQEHILFYQFALMMPSIIYAIICLALFRLRAPQMKRTIVLFMFTIAIPAFWFIAIFVITRLSRHADLSPIVYPLIVLILVSTVALYILLFRLILSVWLMVRKRWTKSAQVLLCFVFGLAAPVGGLVLNRTISFPADFQYWQIYALAVINGIFLMIPATGRDVIDRILFVCRAMFFPFTFYFFMVFVPFIFLSIPAIIAAGAGFLVLTPSIILLLHLRVMIGDFRRLFGAHALRKGIIITACSLLVLPSLYTLRAVVDRITINSAIEYIYQPDYAKDTTFHGSASILENTLENLTKSKEGNVLPFISPLYDTIVFGNLTLPDSKIEKILHAFFGDNAVQGKSYDPYYSMFVSSKRWQPKVANSASAAELDNSKEVILQSINVVGTTSDGDFLRATVTLDMKNISARQTLDEFRARITTSDGLFVSGYWLHIGSERVPGRVFEKKTAYWVYEMIRETRRDPGLLLYTGDNNLLLRVFPFSKSESRKCEIEFLYPKNSHPELLIAGRKIDLPTASAGNGILVSYGSPHAALFIPKIQAAKMKMITRNPEVHLIVDWSKEGSASNITILDAIDRIIQRFPKAKKFSLSFANYEITDCAEGVSSSDLSRVCREQMASGTFARRGGFPGDRAVRHAIMKYSSAETFPLVVVITQSKNPFTQNQGSYFSRMIPDTDGFYYTADGKNLSALSFNGVPLPSLAKYSVRMISADSEKCFFRTDDKDHLISFQSTGAKEITAYAAKGNYHPQIITCAEGSKGSLALAGFSSFFLKEINPSRTDLSKLLVMAAKESGVINGASSYIVVEDSSQWRILEEKEKQKLNNNDELEIMNSPEPPLWLMILCVAGFLLLKRAKYFIKKRKGSV